MRRFLSFLGLVVALTALMYGMWFIGAEFLPEGLLRPYFSRIFSVRVGEFNLWRIFLANLVPFLGVQFLNLYRVRGHAGGLYVLPVFWALYGLSLGTNSFIFAGQPVPISLSVLWTRVGFTELFSYALGYEASRQWGLWEQQGLWGTRRITGGRWRPQLMDWAYFLAGLVLLFISAGREVQ